VAIVMVAATEEREDIAPAYLGGGFTCHMRGLDEVTHGTTGKVAKLTEHACSAGASQCDARSGSVNLVISA
jgi:hypothetical protein